MGRNLENTNPNQTPDHIHLHPCSSTPVQGWEPQRQTNPDIPTDLMVEILSRLPVKSLLRLRSVSKSWLALISSPRLIKTHLKKASHDQSYTHHRLLFTDIHPTFKFRQSPLDSVLSSASRSARFVASISEPANLHHPMRFRSSESAEIVGSCNGLVCIVIPKHQVFIWNPALRKFKKLPYFGSKTECHPVVGSFTSYGFGYDELSDDYKVVGISCVFYFGSEHPDVMVEIYSLQNDSWKRLPDWEVNLLSHRGHLAHGKLHWLTISRPDGNRGPRGYKILGVDLSSEVFQVVEPPDCVGAFSWTSDWTIEDLGGFLSVLCYYRKSHADIWIMKEYGVKESWTKIRLVRILYDPNWNLWCTTLFLSKEGQILFQLGKGLSLHRPARGGFNTYLRITNLDPVLQSVVYVESLVLPNAFDEVQSRRASICD